MRASTYLVCIIALSLALACIADAVAMQWFASHRYSADTRFAEVSP